MRRHLPEEVARETKRQQKREYRQPKRAKVQEMRDQENLEEIQQFEMEDA